MKQSTIMTRLAILILFLGVASYLIASAWQRLTDPFTTVLVYAYSVDDAAKATGYLAREEFVLSGGGGIVDLAADEGERLGAGQTAALLYRDEAALQRRQTLRALELRLDQLQYSLRQGTGIAEAGQLDEEIFSNLEDLRLSASAGDYGGLVSRTLTLKSLVFRRNYSGGDSSGELEQLIASVSGQLADLKTAARGDTSSITAPCSGLFSGVVDGYESIFTPAALQQLTVSELKALAAKSPAGTDGTVGKLITSSRWYLAVLVDEAEAARLYEGLLVPVAFMRDYDGELSMRVEWVSKGENGQAAVVLSSSRGLSQLTLLRKQTVDIVFRRYEGLRVPKKALRVLEDGTTGVYAVAGAAAEFRRVSVLTEGEDFYLLAPVQRTPKDPVLRAGDEIIVAAAELYNGKVVR